MTLQSTNAFAQDTPPEVPPRGAPTSGRGFPGMREERKVVARFDANNDGLLNAAERAEARAQLEAETHEGDAPGRRGPQGPAGSATREPVSPGPKVRPDQVEQHPNASMFEPTVLRTLFIEFENTDWEEELEAFHNTDVEVPCTLTVDGVTYPNVGVHFRGASSYMMVPRGHKRSLNLSLDFIDGKQRLYGERTLNLLNGNGDPSLMSAALYSHIARQHIPSPQANFVKVVINGESWGVYGSVEQFDRDFLQEHYSTDKGARWKVKGSPNGRSGLDYVADDLATYKQRYQIKSKDDEDDWKALVELCRTLSETPLEELEAALTPMLDIEGVLWFLALDATLVNTDGYWTRASDYNLYRDPKGVFHIIPHDMNEAFAGTVGGPGMRGGRRGGGGGADAPGGAPPASDGPAGAEQAQQPAGPGEAAGGNPPASRRTGIELDPLVGMSDATKPLRSRLLAVPELRARYLEHVRTLAAESLNWEALGPVVAQYRAVIEQEVKADTRKLTSYEAFQRASADEAPAVAPAAPAATAPAQAQPGPQQGRPRMGLREFADLRSKFLLAYQEKGGQTEEQTSAPHAAGASKESSR